MHLPYTIGSSKTMIYFHANAEDIVLSNELLDYIRSLLKINIIAVEYPGYGIYTETLQKRAANTSQRPFSLKMNSYPHLPNEVYQTHLKDQTHFGRKHPNASKALDKALKNKKNTFDLTLSSHAENEDVVKLEDSSIQLDEDLSFDSGDESGEM